MALGLHLSTSKVRRIIWDQSRALGQDTPRLVSHVGLVWPTLLHRWSSLSLDFPLYKMGVIKGPMSQDWREIKAGENPANTQHLAKVPVGS